MDPKKGLWDLFSITAKTFGTNYAVEEGNIVLDYAQLHSIATSFSGFLKVSADRNPFVVSLLPAGVNYLITSLATLAAGKIVVLIHDTYTKLQVENCLATLNNPLVVTTRSKWGSLAGISHTRVHFLPEEFDPNVSLPSAGEGGASSGEGQNEEAIKDVAYCFFTSGSTGTSKAVLLPATVVLNSAQALIATEPERFNSSMRGLMAVMNSFVPSLGDVWTVFLSGGTICIPSATVRLDMDKLRFWIRDQRITNATFSTPVMEMFLQKDIDKLESLKWVTFGGTRLNPHRFNLKDAHFNAYQIYGSTEFVVGALGTILKGTEHVSPSVGYPIPPLRMYVLDEAGNQVTTPEVRGEIYVAGLPGALMVGYHGQPELTAKVLLPNPFDPEMSPMYKTGDTGYWSAAGTLFVVGRNDEQVKIHGMRLELGEIENALSCYPGIKQAVALVREIEGNKQIWAFCTLKDGVAQPKLEAVEEFLLERLQRHAIPRLIRFMGDFPRTPTGKISRFELFRLDGGNSEASNEATSEKDSDMMKTVRTVWGQALVILPQQIKPSDNFFYIGGNSILVFKVMALLRNAEPRFHDLDPLLLFQFPVLKEFVQALSVAESSGQVSQPSIINFAAEIQLPSNFPAESTRGGRPGGILITGTTGYLGPLLLMDALREYTDKDFYCVIRAKSDEEARKRLERNLDSYSLRDLMIGFERVQCVAGDLAKPRFGMSDEVYGNLLEKVSVIFHAAADVSFMKTYEQLRDSTVAMTKNLLHFAMDGFSSEFHYMSTIGVFDGVEDCSEGFQALECAIPPEVDPNRMVTAYFQSKWVSEQLVWAAASLGLHASIYRIGQIGAHTVSKMVNRTDALAGFVIACQKLGVYPSIELKLPFVDADASTTIIRLSNLRAQDAAEAEGTRVFHLVGSDVGMSDFFKGKEDEVRPVSFENWKDDFEKSVMAELKSEDHINAWLFLKMLQQAEETWAGSGRSLMKNISFSVAETVRATGNSFVKEIQPRMYADLLINLAKTN